MGDRKLSLLVRNIPMTTTCARVKAHLSDFLRSITPNTDAAVDGAHAPSAATRDTALQG